MNWTPIAALAGVLGLRMLGLFLLLPVLALHARAFPDATPFLAGLAIGIYGLTQALLQVPFGAWSDRIGRRRVIVIGPADLRPSAARSRRSPTRSGS